MENKLPSFKFIKRDAVIKLEIGAGTVERFIEVLNYFSEQLTDEQIQKYHKELPSYLEIAKNEKQFSEKWMGPVTTISFFLQQVQKEADVQGQTFEGDGEEYIKSVINEAIAKDNLSAHQSPKQPE